MILLAFNNNLPTISFTLIFLLSFAEKRMGQTKSTQFAVSTQQAAAVPAAANQPTREKHVQCLASAWIQATRSCACCGTSLQGGTATDICACDAAMCAACGKVLCHYEETSCHYCLQQRMAKRCNAAAASHHSHGPRRHLRCGKCDATIAAAIEPEIAKIRQLHSITPQAVCDEPGGSFVLIKSEAESVASSIFGVRNVSHYAHVLQSHPNASGTWILLAQALPESQCVCIGGKSMRKIDCFARVLELEPSNLCIMTNLQLTLGPSDFVSINGQQVGLLDVAVRVVEVAFESPYAWRNVALVMSYYKSRKHITVKGSEYTRRDCLQKTIDLSAEDAFLLYSSAFGLTAEEVLTVSGVEKTRMDILRDMLECRSLTRDFEDVEQLIVFYFGGDMAPMLIAELCFLFPDHPKVVALKKQFQVCRNQAIARGGYGTVFAAKRTKRSSSLPSSEDETPLCVKEMRYDESVNSVNNVAELTVMLCHRLRQHIVRCHFVSFDVEQHLAYVFMERAELGSLSNVLDNKAGGRMHEEEIKWIFSQLLEGLERLHHFGILHRDVKPQNILLFSSGTAKLADFGLSMHSFSKSSNVGSSSGTTNYMPPEAFDGTASAAGDMWSLGVCMAEAATGRLPDPDPNFPLKRPAMRPKVPTHLSSELQSILNSCLSINPAERISAKAARSMKYFDRDELPSDAESTVSFSVFEASFTQISQNSFNEEEDP